MNPVTAVSTRFSFWMVDTDFGIHVGRFIAEHFRGHPQSSTTSKVLTATSVKPPCFPPLLRGESP